MAKLAISLRIEVPAWKKALKAPAKTLGAAAKAALKAGAFDLKEPVEIALLLSCDQEVRTLNKLWRGPDKPTNVLSFPALPEASPPGGPVFLGDVVLALETLEREAKQQDKSFEAHAAHLVVHGVLHLLGFDHHKATLARQMERLEQDVMAGLGYPDPYREG
ncbi:MAG: rRNA maturation RNase YbeY [Alphaproteobacteria bacterium]|jgi:probable rRNA maturation factor|nr:rRNA maturation RNase YbeY [Alphaproteobacteria bacterium]